MVHGKNIDDLSNATRAGARGRLLGNKVKEVGEARPCEVLQYFQFDFGRKWEAFGGIKTKEKDSLTLKF